MDNLIVNTNKLRYLINIAEKSGKASIQAGEILFEIKEQRIFKQEKFNSFAEYVRKELNISETKAYSYIKIYLIFRDDIDNVSKNILVSHLKLLTDLASEERKLIFYSLSNLEEIDYQNNTNKLELRPPYSIDDIQALKTIIENGGFENQEDANTFLIEISEYKEQEVLQKRGLIDVQKTAIEKVSENNGYYDSDETPIKYGAELHSDYFDISDVFKYEPIDEQGLVALFCIIFYQIKNKPFIFDDKKVSFKSIKIIREAYPDGILQIRYLDKPNMIFRDINIEFEFLSKNFIKHNHLKKN